MSLYILCKILSFLARVAQKVFNRPGSYSPVELIILWSFNIQNWFIWSSIRNRIAYANETNIVNKDSPIKKRPTTSHVRTAQNIQRKGTISVIKLNRSKQTNPKNRWFCQQGFWWKKTDHRLALVSSFTNTLAKLPTLHVKVPPENLLKATVPGAPAFQATL